MLEALNVCFAETMESFVMKIFFYTGLFNWVIVFAVFVMKGTISLELIRKTRKLMFYAFAITAVPFVAAFIKYLQRY